MEKSYGNFFRDVPFPKAKIKLYFCKSLIWASCSSIVEILELGKTKNLAPSGQYEIMNEGYIAAFKIACDEIDDEAFKADAKVFASKGKVGEENEF